jgi:hypothetical protein
MGARNFIESWTDNPQDIGPIYPFGGSEWLWLTLVIGFWLGWMVWEIRAEQQDHEATARRVREGTER